MLKNLTIRNFAIVESLELAFNEGMSVLSGETGAGKSILLDALGLTLGDRADSSVVRHGCERAEISATFNVAASPAVIDWLRDHELDMDDECIIRRTVTTDGRSRGFINGQPAPVQSLKQLGEQLVDIHGQHAHQSLLRRDEQRRLLDDFGGNTPLLNKVQAAYKQWQALQDELLRLAAEQSARNARLDLLRYQVDELRTLAITPEELEELNEEQHRLANVTRLQEGAQSAMDRLYENDQFALLSQLETTLAELQELSELDQQLSSASELLEGASIQAREAVSELRHYLDSLDADPERLMVVEQRLTDVHDLSRKHHLTPADLPSLLPALEEELASLEAAETRLEGIETSIAKVLSDYEALASQLSQGRRKAARQLGELVTANMQELGMGGGQFAIELNEQASGPAPFGREQVEFLVSANPGQPMRPLGKVASGGELSRISLAIQVISSGKEGIPTLIFDEVDVGVGGGVAEMVGRQLRRLGSERQVLCVTHQPQVAAQGHHHFAISKQSDGLTTTTQVTLLNSAARTQEVARMLGGMQITAQTLSHASEMIDLAMEKKKTTRQRKKA